MRDLRHDHFWRRIVELESTYTDPDFDAVIARVKTVSGPDVGERYEVVVEALASLSLIEVLAFESQ